MRDSEHSIVAVGISKSVRGGALQCTSVSAKKFVRHSPAGKLVNVHHCCVGQYTAALARRWGWVFDKDRSKGNKGRETS